MEVAIRRRAAFAHFVSLKRVEESAGAQEYYENMQPANHMARMQLGAAKAYAIEQAGKIRKGVTFA
jgi:hypothetical protein